MNTLYHNPRCSKSRIALDFLNETKTDFQVIEYLKTPPIKAEILEICQKLNVPVINIIRTKEALFKELGLSIKDIKSDEEWAEVLATHPKLIERPIYVTDTQAAIGRPLENIKALVI